MGLPSCSKSSLVAPRCPWPTMEDRDGVLYCADHAPAGSRPVLLVPKMPATATIELFNWTSRFVDITEQCFLVSRGEEVLEAVLFTCPPWQRDAEVVITIGGSEECRGPLWALANRGYVPPIRHELGAGVAIHVEIEKVLVNRHQEAMPPPQIAVHLLRKVRITMPSE